jgi:DnaJ family protein C protein 7
MRETIHKCKVRAKQASKKDYYKIMGLARNATQDEIRKAYKKLAL